MKKKGGRLGRNGEDVKKKKSSSAFWQWIPTKFSLPAITSKIPTILLVTAGMGEALKGRQLPTYTHHLLRVHLCHKWFET